MMRTFNQLSLAWKLIFAFLALVCLTNVVRGITSTAYYLGAGDFYVRWYHVQFLREGLNPYTAYLSDWLPVVPKSFLDGRTFNTIPEPWVPLGAPTNTAVMMVLLSPFSMLSWYTTKWTWMVFNYLVLIITPRVALGMLPEGEKWPVKYQVLLHLLYGGLFAARNSIGNGQTAPLVVLCMVLTLSLVRKRPWLAGLALGIALSKYSISLPLVLILLYRREIRTIFMGGMVQVVGLAILSVWTRSNPIQILIDNIVIGRQHLALDGIHLTNFLPNGGILVLIGSVVIAGILGWRLWKGWGSDSNNQEMVDLELMSVLTMWILLAMYHGPYDGILLIFPQAMVIHGLLYPHHWNLSVGQRNFVIGLGAVLTVIFALPRAISFTYPAQVPVWWGNFVTNMLTVGIVVILIGCVWVVGKRRAHGEGALLDNN